NRDRRTATIAVRAPESAGELSVDAAYAAGAGWWPLQMARELDDAILSLRTNELELGLWIFNTSGNPDAVVALDQFILDHQDHWFIREVLGMMRRTFARLDVSARSMYAIVEPGSCFAGTLLELALAADRVYMLDDPEQAQPATLTLSRMNFGPLPTVSQTPRLASRFNHDPTVIAALERRVGAKLAAREAVDAGLVTSAPDAL